MNIISEIPVYAQGTPPNSQTQAMPSDGETPLLLRDAETGELLPLERGDTFAAEVVDVRPDGMVALKLPDGRRFFAELAAGRPLVPGQKVTLAVTAMRENIPQVEVARIATGGESGASPAVETFIRAMGAPRNEITLPLAREALLQQAPFTPKQFLALAKAAAAFENLPPEQAVFMARHSIPITRANIAQYQAVTQPRAQLGALLQRLLDVLPGGETPPVYAAPAENAAPSSVRQTAQTPQLAELLPVPVGDAASAPTGDAAPPVYTAGETAPEIPQTQTAQPQAVQTPQTAEPPPIPAGNIAPVPAGDAAPVSAGDNAPPVYTIPAGETVPEVPQAQTAQPTIQTPQTAELPTVPAGDIAPAPAGDNAPPVYAVPAGDAAPAVPQAQSAQPTVQTLQTAELPPVPAGDIAPAPTGDNAPTIYAAPAGDAAPEVLLPSAAPRSETARPAQTQTPQSTQTPQAETPAIPEQQQSVSGLLDKLFTRVSPNRARELPRELDAPKQIREIGRLLTSALDIARELPEQPRGEVMRAVRDIVENLRFTEQINHCAAFAQMPLTINGERTTARLYVFNDSKEKKKIDPQNATLFISLATANLGDVEGFVKVIGTGVEADFSLQTEDAARLFRAGLPELRELLEARGYRLERVSAAAAREPAATPAAVEKRRDALAGRYRFNRTV